MYAKPICTSACVYVHVHTLYVLSQMHFHPTIRPQWRMNYPPLISKTTTMEDERLPSKRWIPHYPKASLEWGNCEGHTLPIDLITRYNTTPYQYVYLPTCILRYLIWGPTHNHCTHVHNQCALYLYMYEYTCIHNQRTYPPYVC